MQGLIIKYLLGLLVSGGIIFGAWSFYTTTTNTIETQRKTIEDFRSTNDTNNQTIARLKNDLVVQEETIAQLKRNFEQAEEYQDELIAKLQRHDLTRLSLQKTGLIEIRVNNATKQLFEDLESITARRD